LELLPKSNCLKIAPGLYPWGRMKFILTAQPQRHSTNRGFARLNFFVSFENALCFQSSLLPIFAGEGSDSNDQHSWVEQKLQKKKQYFGR
jgi:hypothetical protein